MGDCASQASSPPKVLVVSCYFPPQGVGGAEIVAFRQAKAMQNRGWTVKVFAADFSWSGGKAISVAQETVEGLSVARAHIKLRDEFVFLNPSSERPFARLLREFAPDVVHFHNFSFIGFNLIGLAKASGAKIIVTLHDRWAFCFKGTLLRGDLSPCPDFNQCALCAPTLPTPDGFLPPRLRRDYIMSQLARADVLVAPSMGLAEDFPKACADPARIEILSSGIDLSIIPPRLRQPRGMVGFVCGAYLGEHKGILILARALDILWSDRSLRGKWRLLIAGDGPLSEQLRDLIRDKDMAGAVEAPGQLSRENLLARLAEADVAILPSICVENQPVWLLEGLASGAALVASQVGGNVELVEDGVNGLLYRRDDPEALAAALRKLILFPELVSAFSSENLRRRPQFDETATAAALDLIYRSKPADRTIRDQILACGLNRDPAAAGAAVESFPESLNGGRIRLVWWRWRVAPPGARPALWIFSLGRRPMDWARAVIGWGPAPFLKHLQRRGGVYSRKKSDEDEAS
jgi:glycosyltransferase involved in cell wall biosynthesis